MTNPNPKYAKTKISKSPVKVKVREKNGQERHQNKSKITIHDLYGANEKKNKKIKELLSLLNTRQVDKDAPYFWEDKNEFGDIVGLVPIDRFYEVVKGSKFSEYREWVKDICLKYIVIDIDSSNSKYVYNNNDLKKKQMLEKNRFIYIKNSNINLIIEEILNIK